MPRNVPRTRFPGQGEEVFSTLVRDGVAGIVHTHSVAWKADIEVAGRGPIQRWHPFLGYMMEYMYIYIILYIYNCIYIYIIVYIYIILNI